MSSSNPSVYVKDKRRILTTLKYDCCQQDILANIRSKQQCFGEKNIVHCPFKTVLPESKVNQTEPQNGGRLIVKSVPTNTNKRQSSCQRPYGFNHRQQMKTQSLRNKHNLNGHFTLNTDQPSVRSRQQHVETTDDLACGYSPCVLASYQEKQDEMHMDYICENSLSSEYVKDWCKRRAEDRPPGKRC